MMRGNNLNNFLKVSSVSARDNVSEFKLVKRTNQTKIELIRLR